MRGGIRKTVVEPLVAHLRSEQGVEPQDLLPIPVAECSDVHADPPAEPRSVIARTGSPRPRRRRRPWVRAGCLASEPLRAAATAATTPATPESMVAGATSDARMAPGMAARRRSSHGGMRTRLPRQSPDALVA